MKTIALVVALMAIACGKEQATPSPATEPSAERYVQPVDKLWLDYSEEGGVK